MSTSSRQGVLAKFLNRSDQANRGKRELLVFGILALCAASLYANTLFNGFVFDDTEQVLDNPYVQSFRYIRQIFTSGVWSFNGPVNSNYYRPMMSLGFLVSYKLFGRVPFGFHLINVALHLGVICALFILTERMFRERGLAFWTTVIFALHPIHTESVAWISGITDLELTFFYLLTFFLFLQVARPAGQASRRTRLAMLASFALAALSKEPALTLPLLATIYEHFFREDRRETTWLQKMARYDLLWFAAAVYLLVRIRLLGAFAPGRNPETLTPIQTALSAMALFGLYLGKLLYPVHLCAWYVFHKSTSLLDWRVLVGGGGLLACIALFIIVWRRARPLAFGLVWLLITLLPVMNANWVGQSAFAERYLYLPSIGFCWLLAGGGLRLWKCLSHFRVAYRNSFAVCLGVLGVLCSVRIVTRNRQWHDNLTFYVRTLAASPDAYYLRNNLGSVYAELGRDKDAEREWREVLRTHPDHAIALGNLGMLYADHGLRQLGAEYVERGVKAQPWLPEDHIKLGFIYTDMDQLVKAEAQFRAAIAAAPYSTRGYVGLAYFYSHKHDDAQEERTLLLAESVNPSDSHVRSTLGSFYAKKGRKAEARREYGAALKLDPSNTDAVNGLR